MFEILDSRIASESMDSCMEETAGCWGCAVCAACAACLACIACASCGLCVVPALGQIIIVAAAGGITASVTTSVTTASTSAAVAIAVSG